jgi:hypothetical protein
MSGQRNPRKKPPKFYVKWAEMKARCYRKSHKRYDLWGGRGIRVSEEWLVFKNFQKWCLDTFEEGKTLDRIDNDGNYCPNNCRWATHSEQMKNRRQTPRLIESRIANQKLFIKKYIHIYGDPLTRTEKFCGMCEVKKPLLEFQTNRASRDGVTGYCRICWNKKARDRYHASK